jgi:long-subunit fatty acid transport protein
MIVVISFLVFAQSASAQLGESEATVGNDFGVGARAMGMGGAFIGVADDSSALYWNPGGLCQIRRMEFFAALSHEKFETATDYFSGSASTFASNTEPNSFTIVLPVPVYRGGLAFALGVNRLQSFDFRLRYKGFNESSFEENPDFGQLFVDETFNESGGIYAWSFGAAAEIAPDLSLGGSLDFLSGGYLMEFKSDVDDTEELDEVLTGFSFRDSIEPDYFGVDGRIGILAHPIPQIRLGATVTIPLDFSVDEYWSQETFEAYDDGTDYSSSDDGVFHYDISRPPRFGGGISVSPVPGAMMAADVLYTDWTQTRYSEPPSYDISNEDFLEDYRSTFQLRVGGEYTIPGAGLSIRGGYMFDPRSYDPEYIEIDTDRQFVTVGIGMIMAEVLSLDLAYVRGFWDESTTDGVIKKNMDINRVFLSALYKF